MTRVSDIVGAIETQLASVFPDHRRIPNPYALESASFATLNRAYGIAIGEGTPMRAEVGAKRAFQERTFEVILAQELPMTEHDAAGRVGVEKEMLSDYASLREAFEENSQLGGLAISTEYAGDSGIGFLSGDIGRFIIMTTSFVVSYSETFT